METNLLNCAADYVEGYCNAVLLARDYYEEVNEKYCLAFKVTELYATGKFKVAYSWSPGKVKSRKLEPWANEDFSYEKDNWFTVLKSDSFRKLTKEIMDAIDEVCKFPFDEEMERVLNCD